MPSIAQIRISPVEETQLIYNGVDRISNLPESIISHILSCLPAKDALKTSVLSRDWEYKWTSIYNLTISDIQVPIASDFVRLMERLLLRSLSGNVRNFDLICLHKHDLTRTTAWISPILGSNLETFKLQYAHGAFLLPQGLLNCKSLRSLYLALECIFKVPVVNSFPNLTCLYLDNVEILNENSNTDTLIFKFPVLKTFILRDCLWLNVKFVEIHAPKLDEFTTRNEWKIKWCGRMRNYSIKIVEARLAKFETKGSFYDMFNLERSTVSCVALFSFSSSFCITTETDEEFGLKVRRLLHELSSMKHLLLHGSMAEGFAQSKHENPLPRCDKLEWIEMVMGRPIEISDDHALLFELLHAAPFLKFLEIDMGYFWDDFNFDAVEVVPSCIVSSLEKVMFKYKDHYKEHQFKLESFFFKNGAQLKEVRYWVDDVSQKAKIGRWLSTFANASTYL